MTAAAKPDYAALFRIYADEHGHKRNGQPSALRVLGFMPWNLPTVMLSGFLYGQEMQRAQADARAMHSTLSRLLPESVWRARYTPVGEHSTGADDKWIKRPWRLT